MANVRTHIKGVFAIVDQEFVTELEGKQVLLIGPSDQDGGNPTNRWAAVLDEGRLTPIASLVLGVDRTIHIEHTDGNRLNCKRDNLTARPDLPRSTYALRGFAAVQASRNAKSKETKKS